MLTSSSQHDERMRHFETAGLYLVTSQSLSAGRTTLEIVRAALAGGVKLVQLREKEMTLREYTVLAEQVRNLTAQAGALMIVNDHLDVALAVGADGVHLGQDDFPIPAARRLGPDLIVGASTHSVEEALQAQTEGASYINIGPIYPTDTKHWEDRFLGIEGLKRIAAVSRIPFTVMGGIKREHIPELVCAGAQTIGIVTAVTMAPDPSRVVAELLATLREVARTRGARARKAEL